MTSQLQMPEIATYAEIAEYLKLSKKTVYSMTHEKRFKQGIYIGQGRFNLSRLKAAIEETGSHLRTGERW